MLHRGYKMHMPRSVENANISDPWCAPEYTPIAESMAKSFLWAVEAGCEPKITNFSKSFLAVIYA